MALDAYCSAMLYCIKIALAEEKRTMFYVLLVFAILAFPVWMSTWRNRPIDIYLPYGMILAAIIAFAFGLIDALPTGTFVVGLFFIACWVATAWLVVRKRSHRAFFTNICTPGMVLYILLCICIICVQKNRTVWVQDDYNYWFRA